MTTPLAPDPLLTTARAQAAAGAWPEVCASLAREAEATRARPELATLMGEALLRTGSTRDARSWLSGVLPQLEGGRNAPALRKAVNLAGAAAFELGELDDAEAMFERALELARRDNDDLTAARATNNLGAIADMRGRRDSALALYQLAIPAYQRLGHPLGLAESYHNMAITLRGASQLDGADEYERRAIEFAREAASPRLAAMAQVGRAEVCLARGDARMAAAQARRAARDFANVPDPVREADALRLTGVALLSIGDHHEARNAIERALSLAHTHGSALVEAESLRARAQLRTATGDTVGARADDDAAGVIFTRLQVRDEGRGTRDEGRGVMG